MFAKGLTKSAGFLSTTKNILSGGSAGLSSGMTEAAEDKIKKHIKLEGLAHIGHGYNAAKKVTGAHNVAKEIGHGVGKAAPSLAVLGAGIYGAKKLYEKAVKPKRRSTDEYYQY